MWSGCTYRLPGPLEDGQFVWPSRPTAATRPRAHVFLPRVGSPPETVRTEVLLGGRQT